MGVPVNVEQPIKGKRRQHGRPAGLPEGQG
jgi:hypothetical protein